MRGDVLAERAERGDRREGLFGHERTVARGSINQPAETFESRLAPRPGQIWTPTVAAGRAGQTSCSTVELGYVTRF